ncbi:hypothetical protein B0T24DRAFT_681429 [Lasiosphaeria ovina]|uniref:Heterokaryon incompatibility domain-containing protein n=1 Tax=Lasiosphaeria ovina TaxID=92902 RepID=A0AAE0K4Q9_9PEZI|nr:hypothetical protein B0T24DRAFT_681429 [Lasiosphaeria ovina]
MSRASRIKIQNLLVFQGDSLVSQHLNALSNGERPGFDVQTGISLFIILWQRLDRSPQLRRGHDLFYRITDFGNQASSKAGWKLAEGRMLATAPSPGYRRRPHWIIDTAADCIVVAKSLPYVCLSYVLGNTPGDQLELGNLSDVQTTESLASRRIPKTVSDAIIIVKKMGLRYLWVDRLCIVQDDPDTKQ